MANLLPLTAPTLLAWEAVARDEQREPGGDWRVWYLRGGRGSGKSRTGGQTLAAWIVQHEAGEWAIVAPTFGDARSVCVEGESGLLRALGGYPGPEVVGWNRSEGLLTMRNGSRVYLDGADDGALRIQGKNLRGCWCDEIGLWRDWQRAWNESIQFAVRLDPGRIVATGTPKMGHGLVAKLLSDPSVVVTVMKTTDNAANLQPATLESLLAEYAGSTLGRQELDAEFIEALEGEILRRHDWRYFPADLPVTVRDVARLGQTLRFEQVVHSWDTTWKAKATSDFVAGQVWGVRGPDRYLLDVFHDRASLDTTVLAMSRMVEWARGLWPDVPHRILIESAGFGPEAAAEMRRRVDGVMSVSARGDKAMRAVAASPALETGHCFLPGHADPDPAGKGYADSTPPKVQAFVEECSRFQADMRHEHDDQVDAWSQMVNWTRRGGPVRASLPRRRSRTPVTAGHLEPIGGGFRG